MGGTFRGYARGYGFRVLGHTGLYRADQGKIGGRLKKFNGFAGSAGAFPYQPGTARN
jgi:hypothetical protein